MGSVRAAMSDRRYVEAGRVCLINYGPNVGKLCVIVTVVDSKFALIDGPSSITGVRRHLMPLKRLSITNIKCDIASGAKVSVLEHAFKEAEVAKKWAATSWAKGIAKKQAKANMTDFDRFQYMIARKYRARVVKKSMKDQKK